MIREPEEELDEVLEAQRQGHSYIKVILHRDMVQRAQSEILVSNVVVLVGIKKGLGTGGIPDFDFEVKSGGDLVFHFSREDRAFVAWMYDDQGPGYFSPIGYNRDVLASHMNENMFVIQNETILEDIQNRNKYMKENPNKKNTTPKIPTLSTNMDSADDIESQIEYLRKKLETVKGGGQIASLSEKSQRDVDVDPDVPNAAPAKTPEEIIAEHKLAEKRAKRNAAQKKYRNKKRQANRTRKPEGEVIGA